MNDEPETLNYKKAEELFLLLLEIQQRHIDQEPSAVAAEHLNLARLYRDMRRDVDAEKNFKIAADLWKKAGEPPYSDRNDSPDKRSTQQQVLVLRELAEFYSSQEHFDKAEEAYDRIIDIQENYDLSMGREIADSYSELGEIYQAREQTQKAEFAFSLANQIQQATLKFKRNEFGPLCTDMLEIAPLYVGLQRYFQAKQAYDLAADFGDRTRGRTSEIEATLNRGLAALSTATVIVRYLDTGRRILPVVDPAKGRTQQPNL